MYEVSAQHDGSCSRTQFNASAQNTPAISSSPCFHLFPTPDHSRVLFDNVTAQCIFLCATRRMVVAHTGKCPNQRPNVEPIFKTEYVRLFFFVPSCGNASCRLYLRQHNRVFTCAALIQLTLGFVLPTQDVRFPRRSCLQAPKPNVVNARSGGPFSRPSESARAACCAIASSAASNHTIQEMLRNTATFWNSSLTVVALKVGRPVDDSHTRNIKSHNVSPPKQMQTRENSNWFHTNQRRTRMQCRGPIYMSGKSPGKLSRQTPHISCSNSNTMFESNHVHLRSHFVPILSLSPSSLHRSFAGRNVLAISHMTPPLKNFVLEFYYIYMESCT